MGGLPAFAYFATVCYIYTGKYKICHEGTPEIIGTPQRLPTNTAGTGAPANSVATSHIDFIVEEIPNPRPNPDIFGGRTVKPGGRIKQLGLDILVSGR